MLVEKNSSIVVSYTDSGTTYLVCSRDNDTGGGSFLFSVLFLCAVPCILYTVPGTLVPRRFSCLSPDILAQALNLCTTVV